MTKAKKHPSAVKGTPSSYFTPPTQLHSPARVASDLIPGEQPGRHARREHQEPPGRPACGQKPAPLALSEGQQRRHDKQQDDRPRHKQPVAAPGQAHLPKLSSVLAQAFAEKSEVSEPDRNSWFTCGVAYILLIVGIIVLLIVYLMVTARNQPNSLTLPAVQLVETENSVKLEPNPVQGAPNRGRSARSHTTLDSGSEVSDADILADNRTGNGTHDQGRNGTHDQNDYSARQRK